MGIRVVWTFVWLQQKQNASQTSQNPTKNGLAPTYKPLPQAAMGSAAQRLQRYFKRGSEPAREDHSRAGSLPLGLDLEQSIYKVIQPNRCMNPTI